MSTSLLYHGFGIVGYRYIRTEYQEGGVIFTVSRKEYGLRCPVCKGKRVIGRGSLLRWFHSLPIGKKATYIRTEVTPDVFETLQISYLRKGRSKKAYGFRLISGVGNPRLLPAVNMILAFTWNVGTCSSDVKEQLQVEDPYIREYRCGAQGRISIPGWSTKTRIRTN